MKTKVALLALASTVASVNAACAANAITTAFGIPVETNPTTLDAAQATAYKYCSLADQDDVCCSEATYVGFQDRVDQLTEDLETLAGDRDQYILDRRGDVLEIRDSLNRIVNAVENASGDKATLAAAAALVLGSFGTYAETLTTGFDDLKSNFIEFQKARQTCMEALLEAQVSSWCYACLDDFEGLDGVSGTGADATISDYVGTLASGVTTACYNYISYSAEQSQIISLYSVRTIFSSLATIVEKIINADASVSEDITSVTTAIGRLSLPEDANEKPVSIPTSCTSNGCAWLTTTAFANGLLQNQTIIQGGSVLTSIPALSQVTEGRRLEEAEGRKLQTTWTPVASGVEIAFSDNPGSVDNDQNSAARNGVVACAIAALAAMVI